MGTISNARAVYALFATGTPTKTQSTGDIQIGVASTSLPLTGATKAYCVSATLGGLPQTLTIDMGTGIATIGTAPVSQVETATVVAGAGATSNGNLAVTVTGARITGSPLAFSVALTTATHTTATLIAGAIRTAFNANSALTTVYTVGGTGADITLTEIVGENNDGTLNIAITAGLGVSAIVNSTNTTLGDAGVKLTNGTGDGKDFEGISLGALTETKAVLIKCVSGEVSFDYDGTAYYGDIHAPGLSLIVPGGAQISTADLVITADVESEIEVTIIAQ